VQVTSVNGADLVFSFVNSLTALSAELEGRHYGGGVLELVPSEIERLLVPTVHASIDDLEYLDSAVRTRESPESLLFPQDAAVLNQVGMGANDIASIQEAWWELRGRRQRIADPTQELLV
jgi:adenine-specific DNA-methyltransferase